MRALVTWQSWNFLLALIPVVLAALIAVLGATARRRKSAWLGSTLLPLLALWFVFLPNSCYLFTEVRHFFAVMDGHDLFLRTRGGDQHALAQLAVWSAVAFFNLAGGALTFGLAIRPVRRLALESSPVCRVVEPLFFLLMAVGVYLGLVVRYNSWDLFTRPGEVLARAGGILDRPTLLTAIAVLALILWLSYAMVDVWIDGLLYRWSRWRRPSPAGAA